MWPKPRKWGKMVLPMSRSGSETAETLHNMEKQLRKMQTAQAWTPYLLILLMVFLLARAILA